MHLTCVTIDCIDPRRVAEFWNAALGWGGVAEVEEGHAAVCGPPGGGAYLECVRVPEKKETKNRLHLGCGVDALTDLDAEIERLVALGATFAWEEEFPDHVASSFRNVVLRDVEGNEFCLGAGSMPDG